MIPRLVRFYGGNLDDWLNMPIRWVRSFRLMMRTIQAEESLVAVNVHGVGAGSYKKHTSQKIIRNWSRDSSRYPDITVTGKKRQRIDTEMTIAAVRGIGIGVEIVKRKNG